MGWGIEGKSGVGDRGNSGVGDRGNSGVGDRGKSGTHTYGSGTVSTEQTSLLIYCNITLTCIMVTVGSIFGGNGRWISYLLRSPTLRENTCRGL